MEHTIHPLFHWGSKYDDDGNYLGPVRVEIQSELSDLELYAVCAFDKSHIPISCYVMAVDAEHAILRVRAMAELWHRDCENKRGVDARRMEKYLKPDYVWESEHVDVSSVALQGGQFWAGNSGFSG